MALSSAGSPSSDSCPGLSNGEEAGLEKPSLEPRKSLGEEGLQRGPDALGPAYREDEEEDEEAKKQTPKQRLLGWIQNKLPQLPITNFSRDWQSGRALGALVDSCAPGEGCQVLGVKGTACGEVPWSLD